MPVIWKRLPFSGHLDEFARVENAVWGLAERVCKGCWMRLLVCQLLVDLASDGRFRRVLMVERLYRFLTYFALLALVL